MFKTEYSRLGNIFQEGTARISILSVLRPGSYFLWQVFKIFSGLRRSELRISIHVKWTKNAWQHNL